ncbi:hypothetical protein DPMN_187293 [Dreissena polymorpha]|uniref:Uncharacterized protein n=1 Tax=Dreissena polymorpha TaxID=45954 RepID=A0A9D4DNR6_DREPO|nr:hypothetical protein DPMN_187293 [Dreissena polymorpha]
MLLSLSSMATQPVHQPKTLLIHDERKGALVQRWFRPVYSISWKKGYILEKP